MTDYRNDTERMVNMLRRRFPRVRLEYLSGGIYAAVIPVDTTPRMLVVVTIDDDCSVDCDIVVGLYRDDEDGSIAASAPIDWADSIGRDGDEIARAIVELAAENGAPFNTSGVTR